MENKLEKYKVQINAIQRILDLANTSTDPDLENRLMDARNQLAEKHPHIRHRLKESYLRHLWDLKYIRYYKPLKKFKLEKILPPSELYGKSVCQEIIDKHLTEFSYKDFTTITRIPQILELLEKIGILKKTSKCSNIWYYSIRDLSKVKEYSRKSAYIVT